MTIAVVDTPVTAGQYSAPSAVPPVSLRPLGQANQRLENKYGDEVERISRSMRSAEPMVRMESPWSVSTRNPIVCECLRLERSALINAMEAGCHTVQALSMHTGAGTTCGGCLPRLAELTAETLWQTVYCLEVIDRAPRVKSFRFRGAVLSRPRSDPTGATPYCPGDHRRC
jgi:bacterioferritin-associated ferredoxin